MRNHSVLTSSIVILALVSVFAQVQSAKALPADPDNAALVYYQAFLSFEQAEGELSKMVKDVAEGKAKPNKDVEDYVSGCSGAIRLAVRAGKLPECDWGMVYSDGFAMVMPHLGQVRQLNRVVVASARVEMVRGNYDRAMELCLAARRMAQQVEDPVLISYLVSCSLDRDTYACVRALAHHLSGQPEKFERFKRRFMELEPKKASSSLPALRTEIEVVGLYMSVDRIDELLDELAAGLVSGEPNDPTPRPEITKELLDESYEYYKKHIAGVISLLGEDKPYEQAYGELVAMDARPKKDMEKNQAAVLTSAVFPSMTGWFNVDVATRAVANATTAGLDIYQIKVKSGKLPDELPGGLPKDPFSGKDFEYEKTKTGFILRCGAKDLRKDIVHEFEFGGSE